MTRLSYDMSRCSGRFDFYHNGKWCEQRESCQRYLAWTVLDKAAGIPDYKGIPVVMAVDNCEIKIEADL